MTSNNYKNATSCITFKKHAKTNGTIIMPDQDFHVVIEGEYGDDEGSIHLMNGDTEIVTWEYREWAEDPSLVFIITYTISQGYKGTLVNPQN